MCENAIPNIKPFKLVNLSWQFEKETDICVSCCTLETQEIEFMDRENMKKNKISFVDSLSRCTCFSCMWTKSLRFFLIIFDPLTKFPFYFLFGRTSTYPKTKCLLQRRPAINMIFNEYSSTKNHMMPELLLHVLSQNFPFIERVVNHFIGHSLSTQRVRHSCRHRQKTIFFVPVFTTFTIEILPLKWSSANGGSIECSEYPITLTYELKIIDINIRCDGDWGEVVLSRYPKLFICIFCWTITSTEPLRVKAIAFFPFRHCVFIHMRHLSHTHCPKLFTYNGMHTHLHTLISKQ